MLFIKVFLFVLGIKRDKLFKKNVLVIIEELILKEVGCIWDFVVICL